MATHSIGSNSGRFFARGASDDDSSPISRKHNMIPIPYVDDPNKAAFVDELLLRYYSKQQQKRKQN